MTNCDFSEKTYETAYNTELTRGLNSSQTIFAPSQRLENSLGFDSATNPKANHVIWKVLRVPRPKGVTLQPTYWPKSSPNTLRQRNLSSNPASLILQFKVPDYLQGNRRSAQHHLWNGTEYYRFTTDPHQHSILRDLQTDPNFPAVVRYATPQFHLMNDFDTFQLNDQIIKKSQHVAPSQFDRHPLPNHSVWTYALSGNTAYPNPDGNQQDMQTFTQLIGLVSEHQTELPTEDAESQTEPFDSHVSGLAASCLRAYPQIREGIEQWGQELQRIDELSPAQRELLKNFATVQSTMERIDSRWWLLESMREHPKFDE